MEEFFVKPVAGGAIHAVEVSFGFVGYQLQNYTF
jgi:hypothetical protein